MLLGAVHGGRVYGSCGDWLAHPGDGPMATSATDAFQMPIGNQSATGGLFRDVNEPLDVSRSLARNPPPEESPHAPCNGPHCRNAPDQPIAPVPVQIELRVRDSGFVENVETNLRAEEPTLNDFLGGASAAQGFPRGIDRPPRLAP